LTLDPRINGFRHDLADIALAGRIIAPHYARPTVRACGALATFVRQGPNSEQKAVSELLPGEEFAVLEYAGGWAWGFCVADHIVGYVEAIELTMPSDATHVVCERCAPVASDDRITSPVLANCRWVPGSRRRAGRLPVDRIWLRLIEPPAPDRGS
jgi:hypothetical protein